MKRLITSVIVFCGCFCSSFLRAQEAVPLSLSPEKALVFSPPFEHRFISKNSVHTKNVVNEYKPKYSLPQSFSNTHENRLIRQESLMPLFERLNKGKDVVRIVQIGDSHIRGHVLSVATRLKLEEIFGSNAAIDDKITYQTTAVAKETGMPGLVYSAIGKNGSTFSSFITEEHMQELSSLRPDLIILSFGTNESFGSKYSSSEHITQISSFVKSLHEYCPNSLLLFTTPPGSYIKKKVRGKRNVVKVVNPKTDAVVQSILNYASKHNYAVWDMYHIVGGSSKACLNWTKNGYYQKDRVHFTHDGYIFQGNLLAEAILNAYSTQISNNN